MKIGIDATGLWAANEGAPSGIVNYTVRIINGLLDLDAGHEFVIYFRNGVCEDLVSQRSSATFRMLRSRNRKWLQQTALPLAAVSDSLDVMFFPSNSSSLLYRPRSVVTIHDLHPFTVPERFAVVHSSQVHRTSFRAELNQWYWKNMLRQASQRATRVLAVSSVTKVDIETIFGVAGDKIDVVHEGVDLSVFSQKLSSDDGLVFRRQYGLPERYILGVGTHGYKNVEGSIRAFGKVKERAASPVKLVIAGTKRSLSANVFELVENLGLSDDVVFTDFFPDIDLNRLYRHSELMLFPSFYEGFGLPILEAFASRIPVVASTAGALPEVAGDAALLVEPTDYEGIAAAVLSLLGDPQYRNALVQRGTERVGRFTWHEAATGTLGVLEKAAHDRRQLSTR